LDVCLGCSMAPLAAQPRVLGNARSLSDTGPQPPISRSIAEHGLQQGDGDQNRNYPQRQYSAPLRQHPELAPPKGMPKCVPATYSHQHTFVGRGVWDLEVHSEVLERTVTPEAHTYFRRIVQVTQSELEKLLVYKIQQLFDPVSSKSLADVALKELGSSVGVRLKMPGVSAAAHIAELDSGKVKHWPHRRTNTVHEKAAAEGEHMTKCLVGVLGRILADFGRFADTILKWQKVDNSASAACPQNASESNDHNANAFLTGLNEIPQHADKPLQQPDFKEILERLERQDQENSDLFAKYSSTSSELRENRRKFMKERLLWREQLRRFRRALKNSTDPSLVSLLDHDVQFYDDGDRAAAAEVEVEDVEDVRKKLEEQMEQMKEDYVDQIEDLKEIVEKTRAKMLALQERPDSKRSADLEHKIKELEEHIEQLQGEAATAQDDLEVAQDANTALLEQAAEMKKAQALLQMCMTTQAEEREAEMEGVKEAKAQRRDESTQATPKEFVGSCRRQAPKHLTIDVPSSAEGRHPSKKSLGGESLEDESLEVELRAELAAAKELAMKLVEETENANKQLQVASADNEKLQSELVDQSEAMQVEREHQQRVMSDMQTQTQKLIQETGRQRQDQKATSTQTDSVGSGTPAEEEALKSVKRRTTVLDSANANLTTRLVEAQHSAAHLEERLTAAMKRIAELEEELAQKGSPVTEVKKGGGSTSRKGGGWNFVRDRLKHKTMSTNAKRGSTVSEHREIKFETPPASHPASPHNSQSSSKSSSPRTQKGQVVEQGLASSSRPQNALDFKPAHDTVPQTRVVHLIEQAHSRSRTASESSQWRAIPGINMGDYVTDASSATSSSQKPRTASNAGDTRCAYGGGFSVLENTAWKGNDRQASFETLLPLSSDEYPQASSLSLVATKDGSGLEHDMSHADGTGETFSSCRPPTLGRRLRAATAGTTVSSSCPDVRAHSSASQLPRPRGQTDSSFAGGMLRGPPEQESRPQSALRGRAGTAGGRPLSASSLPAPSRQSARPGSAQKRPSSAGYYGSAIFDSRKGV